MKDKIRKLLAMAQDMGASENERAIASRQAASLMAKHDLDLADLQEEELKEQFDLITGQAMGCRPGKSWAKEVPTWIGVMAWGIKLYTRTRIRSGAGAVYYSGPRDDVEMAQWMLNTLVVQAYEASKGRSLADANAFRNGYAGAIQQRLKAMVKDRESADTETGALVLFQGARERIMTDAFGPENKPRSSQARSSADGREAGSNANLPPARPLTHSHLRLN